MEFSKIIYVMATIAIICAFSFMLTRNNEVIVKMAFIINIIMSCFLILIGEIAIFLPLAFLNFFIFFVANITALNESEKVSFQEPIIDIPTVIAVLIIIGMIAINVFQDIDFLNIESVKLFNLPKENSINFFPYADLISIIFVVFTSAVLFFNTKVTKK